MSAFWNQHQRVILWALLVLGVVALLLVLTNWLIRVLVRRMDAKYPHQQPDTLHLVRRILRTLWVVLGAMALSYVFIDPETYKTVTNHFYLVIYLAIVTIVTLVAAASTNSWFVRSIQQRHESQADYTSYKFLRYLAVAAIYFVGTLLGILAIPSLRGVAQTALGGAGVLALIAGVASQEALANLVGGLFIIAFKPFKINDVIRIANDMVGTVTDITLR